MQRPQWLNNGCAQQGKRSHVQPTLQPRVGSESALPDDVLLGFSSGEAGYGAREPGFSAPRASVEPISRCYSRPAPLPSQVAALGGSLPGAVSRCMCTMAPDKKHRNIQTPVLSSASCHRVACCSLLPHVPVFPLCLPGPATYVLVALCAPAAHVTMGRELQGRGLAASLSDPALLEWRREQRRTREGGAQLH
ncbi:unnamed protein product [Closterium sp. NIES-53]